MQEIDQILEEMNTAQAAVDKASPVAAGQPWTPELVKTLAFSVLGFGFLICILMAFLIWKDKRATDLLRVFSLPLIIVSAVVLVVVGFSDTQIASVIGLLGTIAGYLLGSHQTVRETFNDKADGK